MKARTGVLLAALFATCGAPQALAAAKASCLVVVDAAGDGTSVNGTVPHRDSLDILSADVATGARNLVAVVRLGSVELDPTLATGVAYDFTWRAGGTDQGFSLIQYPDGSRVASFYPDLGRDSTQSVPATATVDSTTKSLVWSVARKANPVLAKRGAKFTSMTVTSAPGTNLGVNQAGGSFTFSGSFGNLDGDRAESVKSYTDLTPSCVKGV
jgi:hypothetical protein